MKAGLQRWRLSPVAWIWAFLLLNFAYLVPDNINGLSRFALLAAMAEDGSFAIDRHHGMTIDWARTPDGHYYSNKAPGPALLALPVFYPLRLIGLENGFILQKIVSLSVQVVPMAILAFLILRKLRGTTAAWQQHMVMAALLLGNTAALFMNTFFGHGAAAVWMVALWYGYLRRSILTMGFCFGWLVLSDYGAAVFLLPMLWLLSDARFEGISWTRRLGLLACGGLFPGVLWCLYHFVCFGGIFTLPNKFQNPVFVSGPATTALWGIFSAYPEPKILCELLFGFQRGILWTQPWVLVLLGLLLFRRGDFKRRDTIAFGACGLAFLLLMNAAFNGWHGGNTPGPRYLSVAFPLFAVAIADLQPDLAPAIRRLLWLTLVPSLLLFLAVYSTTHFTPEGHASWPYYKQVLLAPEWGVGMKIKFWLGCLGISGLLLAIYAPIKRTQSA